jgi:hypothetical protein
VFVIFDSVVVYNLGLVQIVSFTPSTTMASTSRSIYRGARRKLVLAFDIGVAYSGISYRYIPPCHTVNIQVADTCLDSLLDPGEVPEIRGVNLKR